MKFTLQHLVNRNLLIKMDSFTAVPTAPPSEHDPLNSPPPNAPPPSYNQAVFQSEKTVYPPPGGVYQPQPPMQQVQPITVPRLPDEHENVQPITVARLPDQHENIQPITVSRLPEEHEEVANNRLMSPLKIFGYFMLIMLLIFLLNFLPKIIYNSRGSSFDEYDLNSSLGDDFYDETG